jgi:hypothetical protein
MEWKMSQNNEQRLLGRMVAMDMTQDAESAAVDIFGGCTYIYTTIGGWKEIDRADNGDQIP